MVQSAPVTEFKAYAEELRPVIEAALDRLTKLGVGCPARLQEAIRYSVLAPGKRLRPLLVLFASEACGSAVEPAIDAACAVELVHVYSLIHDDLPSMDDDDLRRGRPTLHKAYDEATAILAGDALLALAFEVLATGVKPPAVAARCCAELAKAAGAENLVGGQADDLCIGTGPPTVESLESIHARKTGAMFQVALRLGALVAGARDAERDAIEAFGERLGLAFQISDDLLDVCGEEAAVGKRVGKDQDHGKLTFPGLLGVEESKRRAEQLVADACRSLAVFGERGARLESIAHFVVERDR